jgi:uncharacterized Zn finger protein
LTNQTNLFDFISLWLHLNFIFSERQSMISIPVITESDISARVGSSSFQRGQDYFRKGAIYNQRRQGMIIKSKCQGMQADFYIQEVVFGKNGLRSAACSCAVGEGGTCKHIAALLLTWLDAPDSFQEIESVNVILERHTKPELITLIKRMLTQSPELESLLELPIPDESGIHNPLDPKAIRQQAKQAFRGFDRYREWGSQREVLRNLRPILNLAQDYLARADAVSAEIIYSVVVEEVLEHADFMMDDEEGHLIGLLYDCSEHLGECLTLGIDAAFRKGILQLLFRIYRWDVSAGGVGASDPIPDIFSGSTAIQERKQIVAWVREAMPHSNDWNDNYRRQVFGRLLLQLEGSTLDDESYLEICRQTGRTGDLVERLLQLQRVEEAIHAARSAEDYTLLGLAGIFVRFDQAGRAEALIGERLDNTRDTRLVRWLIERASLRGDLAKALALAERLFWMSPQVEHYVEMRKLASTLDRWDELHARTLSRLKKEKQYSFLTSLYVNEGEIGLALKTLEEVPQTWGISQLQIEVAEAAQEQSPRESIRLFTEVVERLINQRGRENYAQAAGHLTRVRAIYRRLGEHESWSALIARLREQHRALRALQEELNQAEL